MRSSTTPMNNTELRKMSNPIPININNAWQMRSPQSFANIDDSTQFDPGIMPDQCISQSSISPSSASYSLSPTQAIYNNNMYQQQMINNNMMNNQTYNNNNILTVNFDNFNTLDLVVSSNQSNQNTITNSGFNTDSFVNLDESNSTNNIAIDLESLLVNTTLSDSSNNILLHHHHQHADEDPNSEENININNNINPMFLFNNNYKTNQFSSNIDLNNNNTNESNKIKHILQKQNEKKYLSPSPPLSSSSSSSSNSSTTFNQQFNNNNANLRQRKIVEEEEGEETSAQQFNQYQYSDVNLQHNNAPMSLPVTSFLDSNSFRFVNSPSLINNQNNSYQHYDSFNNSKQQQMSPLADPVLTQIQMSDSKCKQMVNSNYLVYNAQKQNRKVNFLIQENQTKQQQQYFNPNQFLNTSNAAVNLPLNNNSNVYIQQQQQHNSMSLPVYSNIFDYINNNNKQTDESKRNEMLNSNKSDEIKFSKLKISSPASSTSSSSSNNNNNSSSSTSVSSTAQQYLNIKTEAKADDSTTSLIFSTDVINQQQRQQDDENEYFNDFNQIVLNFNSNEHQQQNVQGSKMDQLDVDSLVNDQDQSWHDLNTIQVDQNLDDSLNLEVEDDNKQNLDEKEQIQMHRFITQNNHHQQQQNQLLAEFEDEESGDEDDEDEYDDDEDEDEDDEDYDDEEDDDEDEEEDINDEDSNFGIQFGDAADFGTNTSRRRSNRVVKSKTNISSSSSLTKMIKANSQQIIKRRQLTNLASSFNATPSIMFANQQQQQQKQQLFVGSVGSSLTMMRRSNASRKHARTTVNSSGVDVHTSNAQQQQVQHMTSSNTKNLFSNLQFSPFSSNATSASHNYTHMNQQQNMVANQQQQQQIPPFQQQSQQSFLSTSLPASHTLDSMMLILNKNNQVQQQQHTGLQFKQQNQPANNLYGLVENKTHNQQHPNLNKLLLNNNSTIQPPKLPTTKMNSVDASKKRQPKSEQPKPQKKRQQKKQDLDQEEEDLDSDSEDDELPSDDDLMKKSIKMEESDYDSDSTELNMSTKSKGKGTSASSSYANHESLFDLMMSSKNRDAYFWQYNIQSKGPKTKKVLTLRNKDPHLHRDFFDPVYQLQALNRVNGSAAVNKLRKGDGNDVTPNTEKLYNLGNQIRDFIQKSYQMNSACFSPPPHSSISSSLNQLGTTPTNNNLLLSSSVDTAFVSSSQPPRVNLKREKNKIASRACRLKKKAQHEANKIKLSGLNEEHKQLIDGINSARELIRTRLTNPEKLPTDKKMIELIDDQIKKKLRTKVAGNSDGYVHSLMLLVEKEKTKQNKGGLYDLSSLQSFAAQQPQTIKIEQIQHHYNIYNTNEAI